MRVCIVYDCLYPYTIGGAERWYRNLAERLAAGGHEVTFLTRRQWGRGARSRRPRRARGRRVTAHGALRGRAAAHRSRRSSSASASWPISCATDGATTSSTRRRFRTSRSWRQHAARGRGRFRLVVDWHEVWTREYWREYLGRVGGRIGWRIQRACLRVPQRAFCFSRLHERRLREQGLCGELTRLEGQYAGAPAPPEPLPARPVAVFAGRHIPEKRVPALVPALARAREQVPELRGEIYGDGPERERVLAAIATAGLEGCVSAPGFVEQEVLEQALATALCLVLPSRREGYGLVVVEAAARGVPSVVVAGPDNAATELVEEGVNGFIAPSAEPDDLAAALVRVYDAGPELRRVDARVVSRQRRAAVARALPSGRPARVFERGFVGLERRSSRSRPRRSAPRSRGRHG